MPRNVYIINGKKADGPAIKRRLDDGRVEKLHQLAGLRLTVREEIGDELSARELNKLTKKRLREQDREAKELDIHLRKVGAASRKTQRQLNRPIYVYANPHTGGHISDREIARFDSIFHISRGSVRKPDGLFSFHCKFSSRGFGERRQNRSRVYKRGEAVKHVRYIIRELARELSQGGLVSNISHDPDELAGFFAALEELESHDRENANVYMSLVVSLPHELTSEGREAVLAEICALLAEHDLPHVGVLHAPDPRGDQRNFHTHIMFSLRPCLIESPGRYAFSADKHSDLNDESFITPFRHNVATILNNAMAREGHERRFTALSDADRGLEPRTKKSGKSTVGEKHWHRRQEQLEVMLRERDLRRARGNVIERLLPKLTTIVVQPVRDVAPEVAQLRRRTLTALRETAAAIALQASVRIAQLEQLHARSTSEAARQPSAMGDVTRGSGPRAGERIADRPAAGFDHANGAEAQVARTQPDRSGGDPERRSAIAAAAWRLRRAPYPPQVRKGDWFSIAPAWTGTYQDVDRFEAEDIIQQIHARKRAETLSVIRSEVEGAKASPFEQDHSMPRLRPDFLPRRLQQALVADPNAPDVLVMLKEGRRFWLEREEQARDADIAKKREAVAEQQRRADQIRDVLKKVDELVASRRMEGAVLNLIRDEIQVIARALVRGRTAMVRGGKVRTFFFEDEGLKQIASQLEAHRIGRRVLAALGDAVANQPFERSRLRATLTMAPLTQQVSYTGQGESIEPAPRGREGNER